MLFHREKKLFYSIYVDDFKMAGVAANIKPMWIQMQKSLKLDPRISFHGGKYLGRVLSSVRPSRDMLDRQHTLLDDILKDKRTGEYDPSLGNRAASDAMRKAGAEREIPQSDSSFLLDP